MRICKKIWIKIMPPRIFVFEISGGHCLCLRCVVEAENVFYPVKEACY